MKKAVQNKTSKTILNRQKYDMMPQKRILLNGESLQNWISEDEGPQINSAT